MPSPCTSARGATREEHGAHGFAARWTRWAAPPVVGAFVRGGAGT